LGGWLAGWDNDITLSVWFFGCENDVAVIWFAPRETYVLDASALVCVLALSILLVSITSKACVFCFLLYVFCFLWYVFCFFLCSFSLLRQQQQKNNKINIIKKAIKLNLFLELLLPPFAFSNLSVFGYGLPLILLVALIFSVVHGEARDLQEAPGK